MKIGINFGAMCDSVAKQVNAQGLTLGPRFRANTVQADADAITRLAVRGYLTQTQTHAARKKLIHFITRLAHPRIK